ncbi:hypothetical protein VFPPC_08488 [Pochonia chlamydosporia 170]|uniref:Ribosome quality control complex subunit 2 n=1 Tax=Pochonia chlamydosporia 170 TaxID=1380566 RepID=A0A179FN60_METCM|nr:hypothetical protein VFPPC_08488 [Pochonia chlamydosporia 170]OAQ67022.1 hypothetical protein VFPPC_08488 [Pochonia chlamydosporia 170]
MKQRFSSLDVKVIAHELNQSLVTLRLANVYDLSSKILLFKFAKPDNKKQLVIDTGFRCHLTEFARTTAAAPSAFVARLRKLLKTRRLTSVTQVGTDRILEFQFSDGQYRLFLEFFASGNIILTDADLKILSLARNVSEGEGQEPQRVGLQYSLENRQNFHGIPPLTKERVCDALKAAVEKAAATTAAKKLKGKPGGDLRKCLAVSITELPPVLVDHILQSNNFDTAVKPAEILENTSLLDELVRLLSDAKSTVESITSSDTCTGYIFAKRRDGKPIEEGGNDDATIARADLLYEDFHPFIPHKLQKDPTMKTLEFKGYNQTVDEFFSSLEGQKLETRLNEREAAAKRKLDAAKADQARRIEGLQGAQVTNMRKAAVIEANVEWVQEAMDAVNGLVAQGMDWVDIGKLVEREQKRKNPVASIIVLPLNLAENLMTLNLAEEDEEEAEQADPFETDDSESEDEKDADSAPNKAEKPAKGLNVEINLGISPWSNAREYYEQRRTAVVKQEKTEQQAARALKNAEQKITEDLKKGLKQEKALLQPIRKLLWFEKFLWFISSDGYLVLGGKDAQQNEMLYKRYLRKGDVYCHADLRGASSVIIKNKPATPDAPIPPATLAQAGNLSVCASEAWDQKAGMGAWWVNADQVSKSAPAGEFLTTGSFMVRGKKNFLPPAQLLLGLGIMFKISEESKARHIKHRIHDVDSALGSDAGADGSDMPSIASVADSGDKEPEDDVGQSDSESDDGQGKEETRANPLQGSGAAEEDDEVEETSAAVSSLSVTDQPAAQDDNNEEEQETGSNNDESELATEVSEAPTKTSQTTHQTATSSASKSAAPKRGQKNKAKKIAQKYKDQDEEDRAAAEALIGATIGQKRQEAEAKAKAEKQAELEAAKERRRAQHQRKQKEIAEHEEIRKVLMDEGVDVLDPEEAEKATPLDALVGTPLPGDEILEAIPVCAPWNALGKFKYKAKMQPGAVKKGKATKEVVERWKADSTKKGALDESSRDTERMWPREVELIKALKAEEIVNCVPAGKVRVMMSGGGGGGGGGAGKGKGGQKGGKGKAKK